MTSANSAKNRQTQVWVTAVWMFLLAVVMISTRSYWSPLLDKPQAAVEDHDEHGTNEHKGHDHAGHDEASSLHLTAQARRNIGLTAEMLQPIKLQEFTRTLNIPARVVELPGRTQVQVASPMTGVVASVYVVQGEAVDPGTLLFKVRLTHEDLVQAQTAFLKTLGELDVEDREIARLTGLDSSGVIAGKRLLERQYSKQKLEAVFNANRESLLLHGLSAEQIDAIVRDRRLLRELEVLSPPLPSHGAAGYLCPMLCREEKQSNSGKCPVCSMDLVSVSTVSSNSDSLSTSEPSPHLFTVQKINITAGSMVRTGDAMAVLADLDRLYIEGRAFEHDAEEITHASRMQASGEPGWDITAVLENNGRGMKTIEGLEIVYVDNKVEDDSRAQRFFVKLPNEVVQDAKTLEGHRFVTWRFKPGQRMQLRIPIEQWKDRIVLPVDAVAQEGAETFVFLENGDHFDQRPVHVEYQDQLWVVIANDGSLFPGDTVAMTGAHQMQVALKNKAGGGVDPHAGHNH